MIQNILLQNLNDIKNINNINNNIRKFNKEETINIDKFNILNDLYNNMCIKKYGNKTKLTEDEKMEARNNGFIFLGLQGSGKTTLINALCGEEVGLVTGIVVSIKNYIYYCKLEGGKCISIIDTPGFGDMDNKYDENILEDIIIFIKQQKIQIKGLLYLINYQCESFDQIAQDCLIKCCKSFQIKDFWKKIIIIFTHCYGIIFNEDSEEIEDINKSNNKEILEEIMTKMKDTCDVIDSKYLKIKYFNSFSHVRKEIQRLQNIKNRDELEIELDQLSQKEYFKIHTLYNLLMS